MKQKKAFNSSTSVHCKAEKIVAKYSFKPLQNHKIIKLISARVPGGNKMWIFTLFFLVFLSFFFFSLMYFFRRYMTRLTPLCRIIMYVIKCQGFSRIHISRGFLRNKEAWCLVGSQSRVCRHDLWSNLSSFVATLSQSFNIVYLLESMRMRARQYVCCCSCCFAGIVVVVVVVVTVLCYWISSQ